MAAWARDLAEKEVLVMAAIISAVVAVAMGGKRRRTRKARQGRASEKNRSPAAAALRCVLYVCVQSGQSNCALRSGDFAS